MFSTSRVIATAITPSENASKRLIFTGRVSAPARAVLLGLMELYWPRIP
jgi:hypothetical protein